MGLGAVGSWVAYTLIKQGFDVIVVDRDTVEQRNIANTLYTEEHIGMRKVDAMDDLVYPFDMYGFSYSRVQASNALEPADIVIDCTDNDEAHRWLQQYSQHHLLPLLHAGVNDGAGSCVWGVHYNPPKTAIIEAPDCAIPYSVGLCVLIAGLALDTVLQYVANGTQISRYIDLKTSTFIVLKVD